MQSFDEVEQWKINEIKFFTFHQTTCAKVNKMKQTVLYGSNKGGVNALKLKVAIIGVERMIEVK